MTEIKAPGKVVVAALKCSSYDNDEVYTKICEGVKLLGGLDQFFHKDEKILLKPNLLSAHGPDAAVTTHPAVFRAVGKLLVDNGYSVSYGDSPARGKPEKVSDISGLTPVAEELGIDWVNFEDGEDVIFPDGIQNKRFYMAKALKDFDALVSLPKMKTHHLTRITGAVKNQFGCIAGFTKPEFHVKLPDVITFSKMLIDINRCLKPRLFIMDGIVAMEGNGPAAGKTVSMNVILMSSDPVAIDSVFSRMVNLAPDRVFSNVFGEEFGLGLMSEKNIEILGDGFWVNEKFDVNRSAVLEKGLTDRIKFLKNWVAPRPVINSDYCTKCGTCVSQCPVSPKAVDWPKDKKGKAIPVYDYKQCIRCYCCQEVCPEGAIVVKNPWLRKVFEFVYERV